MQPVLPISKFFGVFLTLSRSRAFMSSYFVWSILSLILCLPLDFLYDSCNFLTDLSNFNETLYILVEGFFSFFDEWREDLIFLFS